MLADLGQEAHVGHAVGLVDDDELDGVELDVAPVDEVHQAAGAGDGDVDAAAQRVELLAEAVAAVERLDAASRGDRPAGPARRGPARPAHGWARARGPWAGGARPWPTRATMGMPKAMVLPEPVGALPQRSRPARASGRVMAWMGKAEVDALGGRAIGRWARGRRDRRRYGTRGAPGAAGRESSGGCDEGSGRGRPQARWLIGRRHRPLVTRAHACLCARVTISRTVHPSSRPPRAPATVRKTRTGSRLCRTDVGEHRWLTGTTDRRQAHPDHRTGRAGRAARSPGPWPPTTR